MGRELGPDYYDARIKGVALPLEESPWKKVYETAASFLPPVEDQPKILDVGCGTGRLTKLLFELGYRNYTGFDFSSVRVAEAVKYVPEAHFHVADAFAPQAVEMYKEHNTFIILETLEHVQRDLFILESIPRDSTVIFSVPSYDSQGHVRFFSTIPAAFDRYDKIVDIDAIRKIPNVKNPSKFIMVFRGLKR